MPRLAASCGNQVVGSRLALTKSRSSVADEAGNVSNTLAWQFGVVSACETHRRGPRHKRALERKAVFPLSASTATSAIRETGGSCEAGLAQAAAAGFDLTLNTVETQEGLGKLFAHGMKCLLNITPDIGSADTPEAAQVALMEQGQARFHDHPSVLGFWADDPENVDNTEGTPLPETTRSKLAIARDVLRQHAPGRPIVFAISNLPRIAASMPFADVLLAYRYPVPQYHPQMLYGWTLAYCQSVVDQQPIWLNSQAVDLGYGASLMSTEGISSHPRGDARDGLLLDSDRREGVFGLRQLNLSEGDARALG